MSSLPGGFSSFNASSQTTSAAKNSFNSCCIFSLFRILSCTSISSVNFLFSSNATRFSLTVNKLSFGKPDEQEFDDFIECHDVHDDFDLVMLALTDDVSSLSSANPLLNVRGCISQLESFIEESSLTISSDCGAALFELRFFCEGNYNYL